MVNLCRHYAAGTHSKTSHQRREDWKYSKIAEVV